MRPLRRQGTPLSIPKNDRNAKMSQNGQKIFVYKKGTPAEGVPMDKMSMNYGATYLSITQRTE